MISEVFNCDCIEYMRSLPDNHFTLAVADPPYSGGGRNNDEPQDIRNTRGRFSKYAPTIKAGRTGGTWASKYGKGIIDWDVAPPQEFFDELMRVSQHCIIWGGNYFSLPPTRCFLIWKKLTISESFTMAMAEYAWTNFDGNAKLVELPPQGKAGDPRFHPTAKPIALYSWIFRLFAKEGDTIFDPMMGSGSSRIAANHAGLDFWGCEINKEYFDKANERYERECEGIQRIGEHTIIQPTLF